MVRHAFCDGACSGNPGPGGIGVVVAELPTKEVIEEITEGYRLTTNNRMELAAFIKALHVVVDDKENRYKVHSDSLYVVDAINKGYLDRWRRLGWRCADRALKNKDLWVLVHHLWVIASKQKATITYLSGEDKWMRQADELAKGGIYNPANIDSGYECIREGGK